MTTPFDIGGGNIVTNYDAATIEVTHPNGQKMLIARAAAPPQLQQQIDAAEARSRLMGAPPAGGIDAARALAAAGPTKPESEMTDEEFLLAHPGGVSTMGPDDSGYASGPPAPAAPAARIASPQPAASASAAAPQPGPEDTVDQVNRRVQFLRSQPQVVAGGAGGQRVATQTTKLPDAALARLEPLQAEQAIQNEAQAGEVENQGEAQSKGEAELARVAGGQSRRLERALDEQDADRNAYEQRYSAEESKLRELQQQARTDIDPKRWWRQKSTGENILGAIAIGLGAFASALTKTPNYALNIIDTSIQRDIDAQMANREDKRQAAADQAGFMHMLEGKYETKAQMRQAGMVLGRELVASQYEQIAHTTTSDVVRSKALETAAALRGQNAQQAQNLVLQTAGTETRTVTPGAAGGLRKSPAALEADALEAGTYAPFDPKSMIPAAEAIMGVPMQAIDQSHADKINESVAAGQEILRKLDQIQALGAGGKLSPQAKTAVRSLYAGLMLDLKNIDQAGALDAGMQKVAEDLIGPNPTDITTITSAAPTLRATIKAKLRGSLRNRAVPANPNAIPLTMRQRFAPSGGMASGAAPATQPLVEETRD